MEKSFALKNNKTELAEQLNQQIIDYNSRNKLQYLNQNFDALLNNKDFLIFLVVLPIAILNIIQNIQ